MPSKKPITLAPKNKYQRRSSSGMVNFLKYMLIKYGANNHFPKNHRMLCRTCAC
ncbi:conserved hypothetical protein, partial [Trichinella spiralis]|uniref:hypothetical protein n=1 Tax=Trichinella spiralis TaxID=6334 RepID=UPI0001EFE21E